MSYKKYADCIKSRGTYWLPGIDTPVWLSGRIDKDGRCGSAIRDFENVPVYVYSDGSYHLEPEKKNIEPKRFFVITESDEVIYKSNEKRACENYAKQTAKDYPGQKFYCGEAHYYFIHPVEQIKQVNLY